MFPIPWARSFSEIYPEDSRNSQTKVSRKIVFFCLCKHLDHIWPISSNTMDRPPDIADCRFYDCRLILRVFLVALVYQIHGYILERWRVTRDDVDSVFVQAVIPGATKGKQMLLSLLLLLLTSINWLLQAIYSAKYLREMSWQMLWILIEGKQILVYRIPKSLQEEMIMWSMRCIGIQEERSEASRVDHIASLGPHRAAEVFNEGPTWEECDVYGQRRKA